MIHKQLLSVPFAVLPIDFELFKHFLPVIFNEDGTVNTCWQQPFALPTGIALAPTWHQFLSGWVKQSAFVKALKGFFHAV